MSKQVKTIQTLPRRRRILACVVVAVVGVVICLVVQPWLTEPQYKGKSLSEWLNDSGNRPAGTYRTHHTDETITALREMGPEVFPALVNMLDEPSRVERVVFLMIREFPPLRGRFTSPELRRLNAQSALVELGSGAAPAVPLLVPMLSRPATASSALACLRNMGEGGARVLGAAYTNRPAWDAITCQSYINYLRFTPRHDEQTGRAICAFLGDTNADVRLYAIQQSASFTGLSDTLIPELRKNLADEDATIRYWSSNSIAKLEPYSWDYLMGSRAVKLNN